MSKIILIFIFIILAVVNQPVFAKKTSDGIICRETYFVDLPPVIKSCFKDSGEMAIGFIDESKDFLPPNSTDSEGYVIIPKDSIFTTSGGFSRLVKGSYSENYWELTTLRPLGVVVSYNTSGTIVATFNSLTGVLSKKIYPSSVSFAVGNGAGVEGRIFKFYPIVGVNKNTAAGNYSGIITITVPNL